MVVAVSVVWNEGGSPIFEMKAVPVSCSTVSVEEESRRSVLGRRRSALPPRSWTCFALPRLDDHPYVDGTRIAVIGFSCVEFGVTVGYHRDAHTAAKADLLELLDQVFS